MKKLLLYLGIIIVLFGVLFIVNQSIESNTNEQVAEAAQRLYNPEPQNLDSATRGQLENPDYQNIILPDALQEKIDNEEDFFVYFFSPICRFCIESTPVLTELIEETGATVYQYNVYEFQQGYVDYRFNETPTTMYFENGVEKFRFVGSFNNQESREHMKRVLLEIPDATEEELEEFSNSHEGHEH